MGTKGTRQPGRNRRARLRVFHAGNSRCPICSTEFTKPDVLAGSATLEHAPPESLNGSVSCLTCRECNSRGSRIDQHAALARRATHEWSLGQGTRVEMDFFGIKTSSRFVPRDSTSPFPTRVSHLRNGSIKLGRLPNKKPLDAHKGIRFRIPRLSHYETVSMIKSAYLMVFSLMGEGGYKFAESIALRPVREQIRNPGKRILKGCFVVTGSVPTNRSTNRRMAFLCHAARPPLWIVPMWNGRMVLLPCGGPDPIDELTAAANELKIANNQLAGWTTCRFDESAAITGSVSRESGVSDGALLGAMGRVPTNRGEWEWMVVDHQLGQYVALPFGPVGDNADPDSLHLVEMLGKNAVEGRGLDEGGLTGINLGEWSKDMTICGKTERTVGTKITEPEDT